MTDWQPNPGVCPEAARGKLVEVRLRNGYGFKAPADAKFKGVGTDWSLGGSAFDILEWRFA